MYFRSLSHSWLSRRDVRKREPLPVPLPPKFSDDDSPPWTLNVCAYLFDNFCMFSPLILSSGNRKDTHPHPLSPGFLIFRSNQCKRKTESLPPSVLSSSLTPLSFRTFVLLLVVERTCIQFVLFFRPPSHLKQGKIEEGKHLWMYSLSWKNRLSGRQTERHAFVSASASALRVWFSERMETKRQKGLTVIHWHFLFHSPFHALSGGERWVSLSSSCSLHHIT